MPTRRDVVAAGLAVAPLVFGAQALASQERRAPLPLLAALYDPRLSAARAFAGAAAIRTTVHAVAGDATPLWRGALRGEPALSRSAIIGLTSKPTLFCLEPFAREADLRTALRARCTLEEAGGARITVFGEVETALGPGWPHALAVALAHVSTSTLARLSPAPLAPHEPDDADTLYAWLMAPKSEALIGGPSWPSRPA